MDGAASTAEVSLIYTSTTSSRAAGSETTQNRIWSRYAPAVIEASIPSGK